MIEVVRPDWEAPGSVRAISTTRVGGGSNAPFGSLNLAEHVGDDPETVRLNRGKLADGFGLPSEPVWLNQIHSTQVKRVNLAPVTESADASWTDKPGVVCAVMTADCLPLLLCDHTGVRVAAAHAGWRGLLNGIIESTLEALAVPGSQLLAWMGPAIGPDAFEVGDEVRQAFVAVDPGAATAFQAKGDGKWLADLYALTSRRLRAQGVDRISGGEYCTYTDSDRFFSYRRDGVTGRMASLIWID